MHGERHHGWVLLVLCLHEHPLPRLTLPHAFCWAHVKAPGGLVSVHWPAGAHLPQVALQKPPACIQALEHCSAAGMGRTTGVVGL
jgi:hypothetical protein